MSSPTSTPANRVDGTNEAAGSLNFSEDSHGGVHYPTRPSPAKHLSTQSFESPLRHHQRTQSTPRQVKETLHAHSEYTNSEDDGAAIHRINQYIIKQEIGRGSFGAVHLAVDQHGVEYAVKEFSKARLRKRAQSSILRRPHHRPHPAHRGGSLNVPMHRRNASDIHQQEEGGNPLYLIREEIAIMKKLNHHNVVALLEVLDDPTEDSLYMVMEMCKKGVVMKVEVGDRADPYEPEECRCWFRDLILGIEYLHAQGIVHRDIKPDNLLLTDDDVLKVVDFGVSEMFEKESEMTTTKSAGSPAFLPPELCITRHGPISGKAVDIWSMGITLYCLYFGKVPFEKHSVLDLYDSIKSDHPEVSTKEGDEDFQDLIFRLLEKDPEKRITMPELREHAWVTRRGTDPLLSAEENTSDILEPPTAEEMNHAITGNLTNLLVVMKAARRFRGLLARKRPYIMDSLLGQGSRFVQPPLSMEPDSDLQLHQSKSNDTSGSRKGFFRRFRPEKMDLKATQEQDEEDMPTRSSSQFSEFQANILQPTPKRPTFPRHASSRQDTGYSSTSDHQGLEHHGKGQAHDPLEDFRLLQVGTGDVGDGDGPPLGSPPAVCESPPAAELDIYETAYHEEVERLRSRSMHTKLYLTRRVEDAAGLHDDIDSARRSSAPAVIPVARAAAQAVLGHARMRGLQAAGKAARKVDSAAGSLQEKMRQVQAESTARQVDVVKKSVLDAFNNRDARRTEADEKDL